MKQFSKVCDAADWFDPALQTVIDRELEEPARLHRKQWEFAMIFLALQHYGLVTPEKTGLSLGGGRELLIYALARRIKRLIATDLYDSDSDWDTARTGNPDQFLKANMPFPVDPQRFEALRMDMRRLDFPDDHFDFCYSSCSFEHIGDDADFLAHLNEVQRVLKPGGFYVFTTELHFGAETIRDAHNYVFAPAHLRQLIADSTLVPRESEVDARLTPNQVNFPQHAGLMQLFHQNGGEAEALWQACNPHVLLLRGKYPFTSVLFVLQKDLQADPRSTVTFQGVEASRAFIREGLGRYRDHLNRSSFSINPFAALPRTRARFFCDHREFLAAEAPAAGGDNTLFHSDYLWMGSGRRRFQIDLKVTELDPGEACRIQLRIHRYATLRSAQIDCPVELDVPVTQTGEMICDLYLDVDEEHSHAVLGKMQSGICRFADVRITAQTAAPGTPQDHPHQQPQTANFRWEKLWTSLHGALPGFTRKAN